MPPTNFSNMLSDRNELGGIVVFLLMILGFFTYITFLVAAAVLTFGIGSEAETFRYVGF
jgi:hypothetical protein